MTIRLFIATLVTLLSISVAAEAQLPPAQEAEAKRVFFEVMSPYCPGRSLNDCPSSSAATLKQEVRGMIASGESREEIITKLAAKYGEDIRAMPSASGFGMLAWALPGVFLLLGSVAIGFWLKRNAAPQQSDSSGGEKVLDEATRRKIEAAVDGDR
jgi:cytochrome c-type biogenesis protein CcmH